MRTIHKYELQITDVQRVGLPVGWQTALVDVQGSKACLWAIIDTDAPIEDEVIDITGTGRPAPMGGEHIGSFQQPPFVWHVWRRAR